MQNTSKYLTKLSVGIDSAVPAAAMQLHACKKSYPSESVSQLVMNFFYLPQITTGEVAGLVT